MSRKRQSRSSPPAVADEGAPLPWQLALAAVWLVGFCLYFFSLGLPNQQGYPRYEIWFALPELLSEPFASSAHSGWRYLLQRWDLVLVAGFILAGAWGSGHLLLRIVVPQLIERTVERTVFALALGLSALTLITLACGLAGFLWRGLLAALIGTSIVLELVVRIRSTSRAHGAAKDLGKLETTEQPTVIGLFKTACLAAMAPFLLAIFLGALLPSTDFDSNEYHLQGPKEFFEAGRIMFLPHNVYTSFPFLTEMLSLLAMVLRDDWYRGALAGKTVLMGFAPLTALALYAAGHRWFHPAAGWLAATIFLTTPWTYRISTGIAYVEGGLTCYLFVGLLATLIAVERYTRGGGRLATREFLLAGLMAGSAMACKYPGVLSVVIPLGLLAVAAAVSPGRVAYLFKFEVNLTPTDVTPTARSITNRCLPVLAFGLGVVLTIGPWLLKNVAETGNPVYPLMYSLFGGTDIDDALDVKFREGHRTPDDKRRLPFWLTDVSARNDWLSPLLYGFAPLAFLWRRQRKLVFTLWLYAAWLFATWWMFTHRLDRFWVPMISVVALLAGVGATWTSRSSWILIVTTAFALMVPFNLAFVCSGVSGYNAYFVDLDYARQWTTQRYAPAIAYLNREVPDTARVLCVGEAQVFDTEVPVVYNTVFDRSIFEDWFANPAAGTPASELKLRPPKEIREKLQAEGITHVLVNWQEVLRYRLTYGYTDFVAPGRFSELQQAGVLGPPVMPSYQTFSELTEREQREIERFAPELRTLLGSEEIFVATQVYPVTRSETAD